MFCISPPFKKVYSIRYIGRYKEVGVLARISWLMQSYLQTLNLQNENQWSFKAQRSTEDLLLHMSELWLDHGKVIAVLFLDFKKAFDSISHVVLLKQKAFSLWNFR